MDKPRAGPQSKIRRHGAEEAVNPVLLAGGTLQEGCEAFEKFTGEHIAGQPCGSTTAVSRRRGSGRKISRC